MSNKPCVLIFAGLDPSGGAGIQADITTICALGAHPLSIITTLTVQDNNRVYGIEPVAAALIEQQAQALFKTISIAAIKVGIIGNQANANAKRSRRVQ